MKTITHLTVFTAVFGLMASPMFADMNRRSSSRSSVNHNANVNHNVNANRNVNVNQNVNVNRNVNVNVDVHGGYYHPAYYDHPIATAAAVTAATMVTAAIVGSILYTPPPSYTMVVVNGVTYMQSGSTYYMPQINGTTTSYVVVAPPR